MPTGPFANLGKWTAIDETSGKPNVSGPSATIEIVKATSKFIKYKRRYSGSPTESRTVRHAKVRFMGKGVWAAWLGNYQAVWVAPRDKLRGELARALLTR